MLTAIALAAVLGGAPSQPAGTLKLNNVRWTVGELGPTRTPGPLLPGDVLFIAYDIDGISIDGAGIAKYTMAMEVTDSGGKLLFRQDPRTLEDHVPLRGNNVPARAFITIGLDQPPGGYVCKLSVTDPKTKASDSFTVKFEVAKKEFGIVGVYAAYDEDGRLSAPTTGQVGQTLFVQYSIASFERNPKTKQPEVEIQFQIYDDKGNKILEEPLKQLQDDKSVTLVKDTAGAFGMRFPLFLSRPGKFVIELKATDRVSKKTSAYKLPITINSAK